MSPKHAPFELVYLKICSWLKFCLNKAFLHFRPTLKVFSHPFKQLEPFFQVPPGELYAPTCPGSIRREQRATTAEQSETPGIHRAGTDDVSSHCAGTDDVSSHCAGADDVSIHRASVDDVSSHCAGAGDVRIHRASAYDVSVCHVGTDDVSSHSAGTDDVSSHCAGTGDANSHCAGADDVSIHRASVDDVSFAGSCCFASGYSDEQRKLLLEVLNKHQENAQVSGQLTRLTTALFGFVSCHLSIWMHFNPAQVSLKILDKSRNRECNATPIFLM